LNHFAQKLAQCFDLKRNWASLWTRPAARRYAHVDGLRAISILWVVAFHVVFVLGYFLPKDEFAALKSSKFLNPLLQGHLGVDIFFVISGFLIGHLLMSEWAKSKTIKVGRFYLRRAFRLLPAYYFAIFLATFVLGKNSENLWANLLYVNNYLPVADQFMAWTWSLAIEEQFYIFCPLLLLLVLNGGGRNRLSVLCLFLLSSFLISFATVYFHDFNLPAPLHPVLDQNSFFALFDTLYDKTHNRFGGLAIGIIVAYLFRFTSAVKWLDQSKTFSQIGMVLSLATIGFFLIVTPFDFWLGESMGKIYLSVDRNVFSLAIGFLILIGLTNAARQSPFIKFLEKEFWLPIAQLSYSAYLVHILVIRWAIKYFCRCFQ